MIGSIGGYNFDNFFPYSSNSDSVKTSQDSDAANELSGVSQTEGVDADKTDPDKKPGRKSSPQDCETCKNRKYQDGSDECDVSFQTAQHIDPSAAGAKVRAHEQEHVVNAYEKAEKEGGKVLSVGVAIHTAVCPECGRVYVDGGVTKSVIASPTDKDDNKDKDQNPYDKQKAFFGSLINTGMRANYKT